MILQIYIYLLHVGYKFGALSDTLNVLAPNRKAHTVLKFYVVLLLRRKYQC